MVFKKGYHNFSREQLKYQFKKGQHPWNKGLKKETDSRVMKNIMSTMRNSNWRKNLSLSKMGEKNPNFGKIGDKNIMFGKHHSEETKRKMGKYRKGKIGIYHHSEETKRKLSELNKGKHHTEEAKRKVSEANKGKKPWLGKHHSEETKIKLSISHKNPSEETRKKMSEAKKGEKSYMWKGGISYEPYTIDWRESLKRSIRERDHYTCQLCGKLQSNIIFHIHHIDYNKKNCNPNNLITLCLNCHSKTNVNRDEWEDILTDKMRLNNER